MAVDAMPTEADYKQLMRQYFERQLRNAFAEHAQISGMYYGGEDPSAPEDPYGFIEGARRYHLRMKELSLTESSLPEQDAEAVQLLENSGFGSSYVATANLTRRLVDADLEASRIQHAYHARDFGGIAIRHSQLIDCRNVYETPEASSLTVTTLEQAVEIFLERKAPTVEPKTLKSIRAYMKRMMDILGRDRAIHTLKKQPDGVNLERSVIRIPNHFERDYVHQHAPRQYIV